MSVLKEMQQVAVQEGFNSVNDWLKHVYSKHKSLIKLESIYGFCAHSFSLYLKRAGVKLRQTRQGTSPEEIKKIIELHHQGLTIQQIAKRIGVCYSTVWRRLKENHEA